MFYQFSLEQISVFTYVIVFFAGIFICATPCVYPIIPVIVGYLGAAQIKTKKEGFLRSLCYVLGMSFVYAILGAMASFTGGLFGMVQSIFWVNFFVANVLIIMGLFMLDVFPLPQLPFFQRKTIDNKTGIAGAFSLGVVSGLVFSPCLTPVLGAILAYVAAKKNVFFGISLLFTYALGMGFPFIVLGTFVGLLKKLPKSGYWMVKIKKIFGLLLIASGEYFLVFRR